MSVSKSAAIAMFELLESGVRVPKGTGHIVTDGRLCVLLSRRSGLPADLLFESFLGVPIKETRAIFLDVLDSPEEDRIRYLRNWRRKRDKRRARSDSKDVA